MEQEALKEIQFGKEFLSKIKKWLKLDEIVKGKYLKFQWYIKKKHKLITKTLISRKKSGIIMCITIKKK